MSTCAICADTGMPSATAAKNVATGLSGSMTENRLSWKAKTFSSSRPITKFGTERNRAGTERSTCAARRGSTWVPYARAKARTRATPSADAARANVDGRASPTIVATGWLDLRETPRSPRTKRPSASTSCTQTGRSSP